MINATDNGSFNVMLLVTSSWAGNSVTGQLVKELIEETGSYQDLDDKFKKCFVTVRFDPSILDRMTPSMIIAVLNDYESLKTKVARLVLYWTC